MILKKIAEYAAVLTVGFGLLLGYSWFHDYSNALHECQDNLQKSKTAFWEQFPNAKESSIDDLPPPNFQIKSRSRKTPDMVEHGPREDDQKFNPDKYIKDTQ